MKKDLSAEMLPVRHRVFIDPCKFQQENDNSTKSQCKEVEEESRNENEEGFKRSINKTSILEDPMSVDDRDNEKFEVDEISDLDEADNGSFPIAEIPIAMGFTSVYNWQLSELYPLISIYKFSYLVYWYHFGIRIARRIEEGIGIYSIPSMPGFLTIIGGIYIVHILRSANDKKFMQYQTPYNGCMKHEAV